MIENDVLEARIHSARAEIWKKNKFQPMDNSQSRMIKQPLLKSKQKDKVKYSDTSHLSFLSGSTEPIDAQYHWYLFKYF